MVPGIGWSLRWGRGLRGRCCTVRAPDVGDDDGGDDGDSGDDYDDGGDGDDDGGDGGVAQRVHLRNIMMRVVMVMVYSACTGVEAFKRESRQLCNFIQVKREKLKFDDVQKRSRMTLSPLYLFSSWTARSPPCLLA